MPAPEWVSPVISAFIGLGLPLAISVVAKSTSRVVNLLIAYGSSLTLGALSAWVSGDFTSDVYSSVLAAVAASQIAYNAYWKSKLSGFEPVVTGTPDEHTENPV